jgi:TatA/E family protein of Tat protein translocase
MGALQPWHLIVILVIVLMVFGPGKLPQVGRAVGEGLRELKGAASGGESKEAEGGTTHQSSTQPTAAAAPGSRCTSCGGAITAADKLSGTSGAKLNGEPAPTANKTPVA